MSTFQRLFKQTFVYGLATVLPRMLSFILVPLYTDILPADEYGKISFVFSYIVMFNVLLAYGMETAFFRFFNTASNKKRVTSTSTLSIAISSFVIIAVGFVFKATIALWLQIKLEYFELVLWILLLDALVIIPFAWLRATEQSLRYAILKIVNVFVNLGLNIILLLYISDLANHFSMLEVFVIENFEINYIFISNLIASALTLAMLLPFYFKINYNFDTELWKRMLRYGLPILIAGIAFSINETFDRILLKYLLPDNVAETAIGVYSACYKLALFMTLFATAFRLGIEPFFFKHATHQEAPKTFALITKYFVILGSLIMLSVIVFLPLLKILIVRDPSYWEALKIVPLILFANFCLGIYHNLSVWYKITDKTKFGAYISILGALITIVINFIFIPTLSYLASAIATLVAYGSMMFLSYFFGKKYYPIPYDIPRISFYLVLSIILCILSFYIFDSNYFITIPLLLLFLVVLYVFEFKELKQIIKQS
ncbi:lipopolysaccharide biosynthesis protein [Aquimarina sp. W85]|uniref:lipopolysaccharide biosynthesis protein n=1 Tax=Aquimarina rhodophyticola TaxID=3342246 RepID=UPI00366E32B7